MKTKISFILLLVSYITNAQVQNYNWNFGNNMGMGWKNSESKVLPGMFGTPNELLSDLPKYYTGSIMQTLEGCFTISDYNGDLIVYSDGSNVYNKDNTIVPNGTGLGGNASSAQSGTIVPYPHSFDKYIVLSLNNVNTNELYYSILSKDQDQYIITNKKTRLTGNNGLLGETVSAGKHSNKNDIWVMAVGRGNGNTETNMSGHPYLNVWRLYDDSSENNTLQHEMVTVVDLGNQGVIGNNNPNGYIRFTNDSKHFVWVNYGKGGNVANGGVPFICYGDFNNTTGQITNIRIKRGIQVGNAFGYGVDFTNDNKYLYVTLAPDEVTNFTSALLVYDFEELLEKETQTEIDLIAPIEIISTPLSNVLNSGNPFFGSIQTGPDGRMYIASLGQKEVFVIDNPKDPENLRIYKHINSLVPDPASNTNIYQRKTTYWGLPNFAVPWYNTAIEISQAPSSICINKIVPFNLYIVDGHGFDKVVKMEVDYGDGTPSKIYYGNEIEPGLKSESHIYKEIGKYKIRVNSYDIDNELVNTTVKTIHVNICTVKVNPYLRGEIEQ